MAADRKPEDNNIVITKLTALWALNESGLGGMMFALHIPLTGFFVGGFAVILISLITFYSENRFERILRAMILVLMVKAAASPHSPPPAYLAVAFQGLMGAVLFSAIKKHKFAAVLLAVLAMAESSLQKIIVTTLIFSKSLWEAVDKFLNGIGKDFGINTQVSYSIWIIVVYVGIHVIWGVVVGWFAGSLPRLIGTQTGAVLVQYQQYQQSTNAQAVDEILRSKRKNKFWLRFVIILLFVLAVFIFGEQGKTQTILYVIIRSVAAVLLLFYVLRPALSWLIQRWLASQKGERKQEAAHILTMMPELRKYVRPSWQLAKSRPEKSGRLRYFVLCMVILSLYGK